MRQLLAKIASKVHREKNQGKLLMTSYNMIPNNRDLENHRQVDLANNFKFFLFEFINYKVLFVGTVRAIDIGAILRENTKSI